MKTTTYYLVYVAIALCATLLFAADPINIEASLREVLSGNGSPRLSGKGTYIRTVCKKAVDVNELLEGREFKDEQSKERYLRVMRLTTGLDLSIKQDKTTHTLERLYFDKDKKRRDYISLSPTMVESIRNDLAVIDTLSLKVMAFDGDKSISLTNSQAPDGTTRNYASIMPHGRIYCPKFHQFGRADSEALQAFINVINQGSATFERSTIDGQVHVTLGMANGAVKLEYISAPDKDMSPLYTGLYKSNQLTRETICRDYAQSSNGEWFPREYIENKYAYVKGEKLLTFSETFEAISGTVNFNIPIESSVFSPELSVGTNVIDERYSPPKEFVVKVPPK